jgi:magnesium transporter
MTGQDEDFAMLNDDEPRNDDGPADDLHGLDRGATEELLYFDANPAGAAGLEPRDLSARPTEQGGVRVRCIDYCPNNVHVEEVTDIPAFLARHRPEWCSVRWIDVCGLSDMAILRAFVEKYQLHPLAVEDMLSKQRPKAEDYLASGDHPGRLFVVARMMHAVNHRLTSEQICFFLGRNTLLSFKESPEDVFDPVRQRIAREGTRIRMNDVSFLLYSLIDTIVDHVFPILESYSERLEELERVVLAKPTHQTLVKIHRIKRDLAVLRKGTWPMRELLQTLRREPHVCLSEETRLYLRDVYDHVIMMTELVETYRDFVSGLTEIYMSMVSVRMNEVMKILTIISTIFVPLTFLAGVYGMNMPIPENQFEWMYPAFWAITITVIVGMLGFFKYRGWF